MKLKKLVTFELKIWWSEVFDKMKQFIKFLCVIGTKDLNAFIWENMKEYKISLFENDIRHNKKNTHTQKSLRINDTCSKEWNETINWCTFFYIRSDEPINVTHKNTYKFTPIRNKWNKWIVWRIAKEKKKTKKTKKLKTHNFFWKDAVNI